VNSSGRCNAMVDGGCDEEWAATLGSGTTCRIETVTWPAGYGSARDAAAILGGNRIGPAE
jgi:hypothetical protein